MAGRLRTIDARTLADAVLEPPGYAVKDLLVQGLHILAGAPKTGKSWLALWLCQQVAGGEKVWGYPTQQGTVLYLCLEDGYHRLQDRLLENQRDIRVTRRYFEFMRPYTREYARKNPPTEEYYRQRDFYLHLPRVTGYLSFFRCVAIVLGVAPLYEKEYRQPLSAECREACRKLDRFTAEITLVCREHLDTPEDVQRFLARMDKEMDAITAARSKIRNKQRGCADPAERVKLKKSCAACTAELSRLRKQKQTAYNMIEDNPKLKALLACEMDAWVENDPYLSPREKRVLRNQRPSQEDKTIIR